MSASVLAALLTAVTGVITAVTALISVIKAHQRITAAGSPTQPGGTSSPGSPPGGSR